MWKEIDNKLYKKFIFSDFLQAFGFMSQVAIISEKSGHHPTWLNTYNVVEFWLSTHDANNTVTEKDFLLAKHIDNLKIS
jgi:4a-hydroxytetrahydrobiopterin dehydratase